MTHFFSHYLFFLSFLFPSSFFFLYFFLSFFVLPSFLPYFSKMISNYIASVGLLKIRNLKKIQINFFASPFHWAGIYLQNWQKGEKICQIQFIGRHLFEYKSLALKHYKLFRLKVVLLRDLTLCCVYQGKLLIPGDRCQWNRSGYTRANIRFTIITVTKNTALTFLIPTVYT